MNTITKSHRVTKERPILFSGPMARAIHEARKTQTRRVIPEKELDRYYEYDEYCNAVTLIDGSGPYFRQYEKEFFEGICRYGTPGDRLWVREEHYRFGHWEPVKGKRTKLGRLKWAFVADSDEVLFDAPEVFRRGRHHKDSATPAWHKRLARFMPRALSRITLEIIGIRVERLQDIRDADAIAEGVDRINTTIPGYARERFKRLWESINGSGSWDANPFVWVIEFKRVEVAK